MPFTWSEQGVASRPNQPLLSSPRLSPCPARLDPFNAIKNSSISAVSSQVILTSHYFKWFLKHRHTKFHTLAVPEWEGALPFSFKYKAYKHVYVHHDDGDR